MDTSRNTNSPQPTITWNDIKAKEENEEKLPRTAEAANGLLQDETISIYEVFVNDEAAVGQENTASKPNLSIISSLISGTPQHQQFVQNDYALDLDMSDIISAEDDVQDNSDFAEKAEYFDKEALELEANQSPTKLTEHLVAQQTNPVDRSLPINSQLIDKDDPRSKLHYVKYLKQDGKTLKIWECGICSKEFRHQYTLMRHLPTHTDERNFKCDVCGKAFRQLSTLSQHKAIHSDARPYVCGFCKKTFNRVSTLISHRKTHSEHKPHKCHICGKGFHQKGNLRNHVFTHTNERPYKCKLCNKGFNQMSNLVCHKAKAHARMEKMQYSCGICDKEFPRRSSLRLHEEYKHGIKYREAANAQTTAAATGNSSPAVAANEAGNGRGRNTRIVQSSENEQSNSDLRDKDFHMTEFMENIIIDKIETKAMKTALSQGQTPFALFKPAKSIPVLVKVTPSGNFNHLLTPATADDLKISGTMNTNSAKYSDVDGPKSVQIKVPVVATVTENIEADGKISFLIEPPGPDQEQVYMLQNLRESENRSRHIPTFIHIYPFPPFTDRLLTPVDTISEILPYEDDSYSETVKLLPVEQQIPSSPTSVTASTQMASDEDLFELASLVGIQFVRKIEDGHYEMITNSKTHDLMNSHVEIFGAETIDNILDSVSSNLDLLPTAPVAQELHQQHRSSELILPDDTNNIVMFDPNSDPKTLTYGDFEILDNKDMKQIFDTEDPYWTEQIPFAHLSLTKIDEILNYKSINVNDEYEYE